MSTKIYNGFRLKLDLENYDIFYIKDVIFSFKKELEDFAENLFWKIYTRSVVDCIDDCTLNSKNLNENLREVREKNFHFKKILNEKKNYVDNIFFYDQSFSLVIFPIEIRGKKEIIGMYFTQIKEFENYIFNSKLFEEFSYFNNADIPEEIGEEEWEYRELAWETAFNGSISWVPKYSGITFDLLNEFGNRNLALTAIKNFEKIKKEIPSFEKRCESFAYSNILKLPKEDLDKIVPRSPNIKDKILNSIEFKKELDRVKDILIKDIEFEHFFPMHKKEV